MPITDHAFVDGLVDAFVAQGFTPSDEAALKASLEALIDTWNPTTPSDLAQEVSDFVTDQQTVLDGLQILHVKGTVALVGDLPGSASDGDVYVVSGNGHAYVFLTGLWIDLGVFKGDPGVDGATILAGSAAPLSGLGADGDFYLRKSNYDFYGPKTGGSWGSPTSLIGPPGTDGSDGTDGDDGWTPVFAIVNDGARRVLQVEDWVGGSGTKPTTGQYVGATGLTGTIASAVDIRGSTGATGAAGSSPGLSLAWDTGTSDADPGAGKIRADNATLSSAAHLYIDDVEAGGADITAWLAALDDSTNPGHKGELTLKKLGAATLHVFAITGAITAASGYAKVPVSWVAGQGTISAADPVSLEFSRAGDKGTDGAGTGDVLGPATNTADGVPQWNGSNSKTLKNGRAIGAASSTDLLDRAAGDGRYRQQGSAIDAGDITSGTISSSRLPAIAITSVNVVADQASMLALTAEQGDIAIRTDLNKSFALSSNSPSTLADWKELLTPTDAVLSVAGLTGAITSNDLKSALALVKADVGLGNVDNVSVLGASEIPWPATAMSATANNAPANGSVTLSSNGILLESLDFDASTIERAQFRMRVPKAWDHGDIFAVFVWSHATTTTNFKVAWGLRCQALSDGDAIDAAWGTPQYSNDTGGSADHLYIAPVTAAITPAGSPAAGDWILFEAFRRADDATNDTLAIDARLHEVVLIVTLNAGNDA